MPKNRWSGKAGASKNPPLFGRVLVGSLAVAFLSMALIGAYLVFLSVQRPQTQKSSMHSQDTKLSVQVAKDRTKIDLQTGIPGLVIFLAGSFGLILLTIKVPVRRVLGFEEPPSARGRFGLMITTAPTPILSEDIEHVPLLFWLLFKKKTPAVRVENGTDHI